MKLHEAFAKFRFEDIWDALESMYDPASIDKNSYLFAYNDIVRLSPSPNDRNMVIIVVRGEDGWYDVSGEDGTLNEFRGDPVRWGLDFEPWENWLGFEIGETDIPLVKVVAAILWEMTFHGYGTQDVKEASDKIHECYKNALQMIQDE